MCLLFTSRELIVCFSLAPFCVFRKQKVKVMMIIVRPVFTALQEYLLHSCVLIFASVHKGKAR